MLKASHRQDREGHHSNFTLRVHRTLNWLKSVAQADNFPEQPGPLKDLGKSFRRRVPLGLLMGSRAELPSSEVRERAPSSCPACRSPQYCDP